MNRSETISKLAEALAKAQGQITDAKQDAKNPYYNSTYATLSSVWAAIREPLSTNGLAVTQTTHITESGQLVLETLMMHVSGEWTASHYPIRPMRQNKGEGWQLSEDPQSFGSALSYARRYALAALVGVAEDEDDDGERASGRTAARKVESKSSAIPTNGTASQRKLESQVKPDSQIAYITEAQLARLWATVRKIWPDDKEAVLFRNWLKGTYGVESTKAIAQDDFSDIISHLDALAAEPVQAEA